jgi:hypothetical protein
LPCVDVHYETARLPTSKQWSNRALLSKENIDIYLAQSDAFHRTSFANIIRKWEQYDRNKTNRLISSLDDYYHMKARFRQDNHLTRSSEKKYSSTANYYRLLGNESNPRHSKPCQHHQHRTRAHQDKHVENLLKQSISPRHGKQMCITSKTLRLPSIDMSSDRSSSVSVVQTSEHGHVWVVSMFSRIVFVRYEKICGDFHYVSILTEINGESSVARCQTVADVDTILQSSLSMKQVLDIE